MAPLIVIPCPTCHGDTYLEDERGGVKCVTCNATGQIEMCECCNEVPTVISGFDACGCTVVELGAAA